MRSTAMLVLVLLGCAVDPVLAPRDCTPGQTVPCACPGASGVQTCSAEGTLGACVCSDAGTAPDAGETRDVVIVDAGPPPEDRPDAAVRDAPACALDTRNDPMNCGACGRVCRFAGARARCVLGGCVFDGCLPGYANCNFHTEDGCEIRTDTDNRHCGACGRACAQGQLCGRGVCGSTCGGNGLYECDGLCRDLTSDDANCGVCGNRCPMGQRCSDWMCRPI